MSFLFRVILYLLLAMAILIVANTDWKVGEITSRTVRKYGLDSYAFIPAVAGQGIIGLLAPPPKIYFNIKKLDLVKIASMRKDALGNASHRNFEWLKGNLEYLGKKYDIEFRLKGDRKTHYNDSDGLSYRIKIKGDENLIELSKFSFEKPRQRNYIHEYIYLDLMRQEGILSPRYDFFKLNINGESKGLYALSEFPTSEFLERSNRRDGPIFKLDEDYSSSTKNGVSYEIINSNKWGEGEGEQIIVSRASKILAQLWSGNVTIEEAFNIEKWAKYFALTDILRSYHGAIPKSVRLYYNPLDGRFEPIAYDGHYGAATEFSGISTEIDTFENGELWFNKSDGEWFKLFFSNEKQNKKFLKLYYAYLKEYSNKNFIDRYIEKNQSEINKILSWIYADGSLIDRIFLYGPGLFHFRWQDYFERLKEVENVVDDFQFKYGAIVDSKVSLNLKPTRIHRFLKLSMCDGKPIDGPEFVINPSRIPQNITKYLGVKNITCRVPDIKASDGSIGNYNNNLYPGERFVSMDFNEPQLNFEHGDNLHFYPKRKITKLLKSVRFPKGSTLTMTGGDTIVLASGVYIFIEGDIRFVGDRLTPVVIQSLRSSDPGGGIIVMDGKNSVIEHLNVRNIGSRSLNGYNISGALTFYRSRIKIENLLMENIGADDALNIIDSEFSIDNCKFSITKDDAIDIDFGRGSISNCGFFRVGGDAIDLSMSRVNIFNINAHYIFDKVFSVGERSFANIRDVKVEMAGIGIASKDNSVVVADGGDFRGVGLALASYGKKKEFLGSSEITATRFVFENTKESALSDNGNKIIINGRLVVNNSMNLRNILYGK